ncbi:nicotinate-nucleotide adenylyltransferase [Martelella mediterranea]|uniref:nicotinate-nucleotide adenylyltransferase n=1 Tax=Martelella mediterranea TaxID=293089 RepID=UPI001E5F6A5A|nr:nicotinate-nucleotide adenylyltransferase [Martelella mediterranea]MCD1633213.1 nicotinate-nucleotide adenylyltransferase [Martelella mediterranea]
MPHLQPGMTVGLFGGSFNPPHEGHLLVAKLALQRLGLDQLWWLVTPGNPLKSGNGLAPLAERLALSDAMAGDPRIRVTAIEKTLGTAYTARTIRHIIRRNPAVHFVWIMGADNLGDFHRWQEWRRIAATVPIAVIDRPGATLTYLSSKAARALDRARVPERAARALPRMRPPAWTFIHGPRSAISSTALRQESKR